MNYKEYIKGMKVSKEFYDTIDFTRFMITNMNNEVSVGDLMDSLEEYYDNHVDLLPEEFHGLFFNFMNEDDFSSYLKDRYGYKVRHEVIDRYYISKK